MGSSKVFKTLIVVCFILLLGVLGYLCFSIFSLKKDVQTLKFDITSVSTKFNNFEENYALKSILESQGLLNFASLVAKDTDFTKITNPNFSIRSKPSVPFSEHFTSVYDFIDEVDAKKFSCFSGILVAPNYDKILFDKGVPSSLEFDATSFYSSPSYYTIEANLEKIDSLSYCWLEPSAESSINLRFPDYTFVTWTSLDDSHYMSLKGNKGQIDLTLETSGVVGFNPLMFSDSEIVVAAIRGGGGFLDIEPISIDIATNTFINYDNCASLVSRNSDEGYDANCNDAIEGVSDSQVPDYGFIPVEGYVKVDKPQN